MEEQRNHIGNGGEIHRKETHHVFSAHNPIKRCHLTHKCKARKGFNEFGNAWNAVVLIYKTNVELEAKVNPMEARRC